MRIRAAALVSSGFAPFAVGLLAVTVASALAVGGLSVSGDKAHASAHGRPGTGPAKPAATTQPRKPPPRAWTTGAENLEVGDAVLHGAIDPRGIPTTYHFQYGLTQSYGAIATGIRGTYDGHERLAVEATVFELRPGATYHFRVVAVSKSGKAYGADRTFTSMKSRPKPGTVIACYHEGADRYTARIHPRRCVFRGVGKRAVAIPIRGMKWGHWGVHAPRAAYGVDMRDGERVRVVASRPVTCDDGSTWYSRVGGVFLRRVRGFAFRLPTCDRQ